MFKIDRLIHEKCIGCNRYETFTAGDESRSLCKVYRNPSYWWERKGCPVATHAKREVAEDTSKKRLGQQKQKKKK